MSMSTTTMTANGIKIETHSEKRKNYQNYTQTGGSRRKESISLFAVQAVNAMLQCSTFDLLMVGTQHTKIMMHRSNKLYVMTHQFLFFCIEILSEHKTTHCLQCYTKGPV